MSQSPASRVPYSRSTMRILMVMSVVSSLVILIWGAALAIDGDPDGRTMMIIGGQCALVTAVGIPFGIRRGRL